MPNPAYKPSYNGCGSYGFSVDFDKCFGMKGFNECCNHHDLCYGTCYIGKSYCDNQFLNSLLDKCNEVGKLHKFDDASIRSKKN